MINIVKVKEGSVTIVPTINVSGQGETPLLANTGRAICCVCEREIPEGTPRVRNIKREPTAENKYYTYNFFCYKCAEQKYDFDIGDFKFMINETKSKKKKLKKMIEASKKEIMMMEL